MRSGACAIQQTLTTEAASVLKHSLALARRRGHVQLTPLHVAATLLSSRTSILRRACLKSQPDQPLLTSHPLHGRALELCFSVALNRLPTTPAIPLLHGHAQPSLSNALIAALKRAQALQRRDCVEQQQQQQTPLLEIKVELEQLVISILDDPSVSRVMREAGFSSIAVKNNIEEYSANSSVFQCYTTCRQVGVLSSPSSPSGTETQREIINSSAFWKTHFLTYSSEQNPLLFSPQKKVSSNYFLDLASLKEDIKLVFEVLSSNKRKNAVIVGDSVSITEGLVGELMERIEKGEVPAELKQTQFIKFQFAPVISKEDVEANLLELRRKVASIGEGRAIVYTGDLKWTIEEIGVNGQVSGYKPVDHLVVEIGRLLSDYNSTNTKIWLVAAATYQTYMRCQMRQPSLEIQWSLQAVSVPSAGLGLSLHDSNIPDSRICFSQNPETKSFVSNSKEEADNFRCCHECTFNYGREALLFKSGHQKHFLPWLQPQPTNNNQKDELSELRRKWSRFCQERHTHISFGSTKNNNQSQLLGKSHASYPWWASQNKIFSANSSLKPNQVSNYFSKPEFNFANGSQDHKQREPSLDSLKNINTESKEVKITLALGHSSFSNSEKMGNGKAGYDFCKLLQDNVPWQSELVPSIVEALTRSRNTWLLIQGNDAVGKRRLALAISEFVSGSADMLLHMNLRMRNKGNETITYSEMFVKALRNQENLVVLVEDVDLADTDFLRFLAEGYKTGHFGESVNREKDSGQVVIILTRGNSIERKTDCDCVIQMTLKVTETNTISSEALNIDRKRKAEWDMTGKIKIPRINEKEDTSLIPVENGNMKKELPRQSSSNTLDLNIRANENDECEDKPGFVDVIMNRFEFHQNQLQFKEMTKVFSFKIKQCFEKVFRDQSMVDFNIEDLLLEEVLSGSDSFINSWFEKWIIDVLQTDLQTLKIRGRLENGVGVRLCFGGRNEQVLDDGFKGTCLPKKIQVSFMD